MKSCSYPDCIEEDSLPFKCKLCNQLYCAKHRLPEQHDCPRIGIYQTDEYRKAKVSPGIPKTAEKKEKEKRKQREFYSPRDIEQKSVYTEPQDRFMSRSSFFTLYSFSRNLFNVLVLSIFVGFVLSLNDLVDFRLYQGIPLSSDYLWIILTTFIATLIVFGGHMLAQHITARIQRIRASNVIWLQGAIVSLIGIFIPFTMIPTFLTFRTTEMGNKKRGITALSGIVWILVWEVILISLIGFGSLNPLIRLGLMNIPFFMLFLVAFLLIPFGTFHGRYLSSWNRKVHWGLFASVVALFIYYFVVISLS
ncbi:MAG: hypothetical protein H7645_03955 [Candidatus Heimdallarchaeota archaeon]|nr:hypothetical protein [Candidatus Heimdallarchaeota archaeon]MCK4769471.1 hypothetical protein [Candidatus Heimdallarchaeota archaeon]